MAEAEKLFPGLGQLAFAGVARASFLSFVGFGPDGQAAAVSRRYDHSGAGFGGEIRTGHTGRTTSGRTRKGRVD